MNAHLCCERANLILAIEEHCDCENITETGETDGDVNEYNNYVLRGYNSIALVHKLM